MHVFERLTGKTGSQRVERMSVPGGWLYSLDGAGWVFVPMAQPGSQPPLHQLRRWWSKANPEDRAAFVEWTRTADGSP